MEKIQVHMASQITDFSDYKSYYEVTTRVCYYGEPNGNMVCLPYDDTSLTKAQTLVNMPVQAKYTINSDGQPDLLDHCVSFNDDGSVTFGTESVGTHTSVEIKNDTVKTFDGRTLNLPCLFATSRIWKRYPAYCAAIKRLYDEGNLHTSWEITSFVYQFDNGVKTLNDYVFEANTLLGSTSTPAYGEDAKVVELSQKNNELLVASALSQDLMSATGTDINAAGKEDKSLKVNESNVDPEKNVVKGAVSEVVATETSAAPAAADPTPAAEEVEKPVVEVSAEETPSAEASVEATPVAEVAPAAETTPATAETSTLTASDLYSAISEECRKCADDWGYIAFWFPVEQIVWYHVESAKETEFLQFSYTVANDVVTLGEAIPMALMVGVASINKELSDKNDALVAANNKIEELNSTIEKLSPFKAAYEKAENEKAEAAKEAKKTELKQFASDSKCFTKEELADEKLTKMIDNLDEAGIKSLVADKLVSKLRDTAKPKTSEPAKETSTVQTDLAGADQESDVKNPDEIYLKRMHVFLWN